MKLTGLNIKGFKSFAKETELHFNERVTGIIGPNGSGKSNIVDAIRWVLGEQKPTELRLDNMPDVIFNGTKTIKKGSMAQVTLNFDNTKNILPTEYSNVSISRTLFGSGESEYRLNDIPCRLKDIRNLFIDTGVGPDSYAIIALNKKKEKGNTSAA
ncbi:MAG: AAA family ATPase [Saprospiraceae bacterium]|nr:AAA family ATPase [Saprospiraceae bacterium]